MMLSLAQRADIITAMLLLFNANYIATMMLAGGAAGDQLEIIESRNFAMFLLSAIGFR